jgi:hypothetical protein
MAELTDVTPWAGERRWGRIQRVKASLAATKPTTVVAMAGIVGRIKDARDQSTSAGCRELEAHRCVVLPTR